MDSQRYKLEAGSSDRVTTTEYAPEGGVRAWCSIAGGWLAFFATFGAASSFGVYQDFYVRAGTSSSSNIAWIGSVQLFFLIGMGLPTGKLIDKGYFRSIVLTGSILMVFSYFMLSLAHLNRYYQIFLVQGVGVGLGAGLIYTPSIAIQAHYWTKRRAFAMGLVITGSSVGGIVYPIMLNQLFHRSGGFVWGVRAQAFVTLALLIGANLLMRPPPRRAPSPNIPKARLLAMLTDVPYILTIVGGGLVIVGIFFPYFYLQLFADLHNLPTNFSFYTLTIQNGASILGRTLPNLLADRVGILNAITVASFGTGALIFSMFGLSNVGGVATFAVCYGFVSGSVLSLFSPVMVIYAQDASEIGVRLGFGAFITSFAWLVGPPIAGAILTSANHWNRAIIFSGVIVLSSVPFMLVARHGQSKRKRTQFV